VVQVAAAEVAEQERARLAELAETAELLVALEDLARQERVQEEAVAH
jgi:hypothetical protein